MASYVSIHVASAATDIGSLDHSPLDPVDRFVDLYQSIQAGKFSIVKTSSEISDASLESVWIGKDKAQLSQVDKSLNVVKYVLYYVLNYGLCVCINTCTTILFLYNNNYTVKIFDLIIL